MEGPSITPGLLAIVADGGRTGQRRRGAERAEEVDGAPGGTSAGAGKLERDGMLGAVDDDARRRVQAVYDLVAADYAEALPDASYEAPLDLAMITEFVRLVGSGSQRRILDAGCGTGRMVSHLQYRSAALEITGVDLSAAMIALARDACPETPFVRADLTRLPFDADAFDGILAWYSLIHLEPLELAGAVAEFARVVRSGGIILLAFQHGRGQRRLSRAYGHDVELTAHLHDLADVAPLLQTMGFEPRAQLVRAPRAHERHEQGFVLARRS